MITPEHIRLFARYNRWQNESLYACADRLTDAERKADRGAFFGSIHGTLAHLVWGDQIWMTRFTDDPTWTPRVPSIPESKTAYPDWSELGAARRDQDARIITWATSMSPNDLEGDLSWFSGATQQTISRPRWELIAHMFNHQTHHRGQVHAMLTAAGQKPAATDIAFMDVLGVPQI
jgi:uncharacterized damage-inducible protein DinB